MSVPDATSKSAAVQIAAYLLIIAAMMYASSIITPILLALFVAVICAQPIRWLEKRKVPNGIAVLIVLLGILLLFFGMGEIIARTVSQFRSDLPSYEARFSELSKSIFASLHKLGLNISLDNLESSINTSKIMTYSAGFLSALGSIMSNTLLILFIVIFMLLEINSFKLKIQAIMKISGATAEYLNQIDQSIKNYLGLMTLISLITGVAIWLALTIIGVKYAILWGLLAFILNFIPNFGSIIASIPAIIFALIQLGVGGTIWTVVTYVTVNMVIGNVIQPAVMGKGLGLSSLIVFISLIFWGFIFGTVGMFLSVPLSMVIKIILEQHKSTKWIAIILGTEKEARDIIDSYNK